jgi:hypothetical protein
LFGIKLALADIGFALAITLPLCFNFLSQDIFKSDCIGRKLRDTLTQFLYSHLLLIKVESECSFVVDICLLLDVQACSG